MTPLQWLGVAAYAVVATVLGRLFVRACRLRADPLLDDFACSYLCGQMLMTALTLTTGLLPWGLMTVHTVTTVVAVVGFGWLLARTPRAELARSWRRVAAAFAALALFPHLLHVVHVWPPRNWDARSIWLFHAKAIWFDNGVSAGFFANKAYWWSNLDYPLHVPAHNAWCAWFGGGWSNVASKAFLLVNLCAYFRLSWLLLRQRSFPAWAAVAIAIVLLTQQLPNLQPGEMHVSGLADVHYTVPMALFALAATAAAGQRSIAFALAMLALATGVKAEGYTYAAVIVGGAAAVVGVRALRARQWPPLLQWARTWRRELVFFFVLGGLPFLLWVVFKSIHGITGGLHLFKQVTTPGLLWTNLQERTPLVFELFLASARLTQLHWLAAAWLALWLGSVALQLLGGSSWRPRSAEYAVTLGVGASLAAIFATYMLTPHDVKFHMTTSAPRLLLLPQMLLVVACVLRLEGFVATWRATARPAAAGVPASIASLRR